MKRKIRVFVLGLDGASWNVLEPMINDGKLLTFKKLIKKGTSGKLESITPPISVPAWKCYSTGKNPGELDIYSFLSFDPKNYEYKVVTSKDFNFPDIWNVLSLCGKRSVVYKMFSTYPAKKILGCIVSEYPEMKNGTYPKNLIKEIEEKFGRIYHDVAFTTDREKTYETVLAETEKDFEVIKYLIEKYNPDFVHMSVPHTDGVQHFFWRDMLKPDSPYHDYIEKFWIKIDDLIYNLLNFLDNKEESWHLFIISDHGFTECKYRFNIANWLIKRNYLKLTLKGKVLKAMSKLITLDRAYKIVEIAIKIFGEKLKIRKIRWGAQHDLVANISQKIINFEKSKIIPLEGQILYINPKLFENENDRAKFISKIIRELSEIKRPDGEPLIKQIYDGKKFYSNDSAPDIIILPNNVYLYTMPLISELWTIPPENKWTGMHDLYGVFIAYGRYIKENHKLENLKLTNVMPIIHHLLDIPTAKDVNEDILREIVKKDDISRGVRIQGNVDK